MILLPLSDESTEHAVGVASAAFGVTMLAGQIYMFVSSTNCWISQGDTPVASASAGSIYVAANTPIYLDGRAGGDLAVIRDSADGKSSITRTTRY